MLNICKFEGCSLARYCHGYCSIHNYRFMKHGDPAVIRSRQPSRYLTALENFFLRVHVAGRNECWLWTGYLNDKNYGRLGFKGTYYRATHVMWFAIFGRFPSQDLLHSCDNPPCVNPRHLREGTDQDNSDDMVSRKRSARGAKVATAILNETDVIEIKGLLPTMGISRLARQFHVHHSTISAIKAGRNWGYV